LQPRIWVGSWLDYNNGVLYGEWLAADREQGEIAADIAQMLAASPTGRSTGEVAEEWGIFDFDNFGSLRIEEQDNLGWISHVARGIVEHGAAYAAWAALTPPEEADHDFEHSYRGHYPSAEDYVAELIDESGYNEALDKAVPQSLRPYVQIDTEMLARDMEIEGAFTSVESDEGGTWIFV
jgi:antirestriction protein